jgi:hypothetical protein
VPLHEGESLSDEIEGDADLEGINDDNDDDAFNPPGSMRELDEDLVDEPSSVLLYENQPLPVDAEIAEGVTFYTKNDCKHAIKIITSNTQYSVTLKNLISKGTSLNAVNHNVSLG